MACCTPFEGSAAHHPFCRNNAFALPTETVSFKHTENGTAYCVYDAEPVMAWTLANLGHIMSINGRPLSVTTSHILDSLATSSNIVLSYYAAAALTGFAILEPKVVQMQNKFRALAGEIITKQKKAVVNVDSITVSAVYAVPGHGCDFMGFVRTIVPPGVVLALEAVKGTEAFYHRIGMSKYGEDSKYKSGLFVSSRLNFFHDGPVLQFKKRSTIPVASPFPHLFEDHMLALSSKPRDEIHAITGCVDPPVPIVRKTTSIFKTLELCAKCGSGDFCFCDIDFGDFPVPEHAAAVEQQAVVVQAVEQQAVVVQAVEQTAGVFEGAQAHAALLVREAEEAALRAKAFSGLVSSTEVANAAMAASAEAVAAVKQRADVARKAVEAVELEEAQLLQAHAAAVATSAAAVQLLGAAISRKRSRSP